MTIRTSNSMTDSPLDKKARSAATRIAEKHGIRDRARNTWHTMADELLAELQPAIEEQTRTEADQKAKGRLKAVLELPEAKGRRDLAERLALETDSSVEQARSILESTPRAAHDPLGVYMRGRTPGINSDAGDVEDCDSEEEAARQILAADGGATNQENYG